MTHEQAQMFNEIDRVLSEVRDVVAALKSPSRAQIAAMVLPSQIRVNFQFGLDANVKDSVMAADALLIELAKPNEGKPI